MLAERLWESHKLCRYKCSQVIWVAESVYVAILESSRSNTGPALLRHAAHSMAMLSYGECMSTLNKDGVVITESNPFHIIDDDLRKSIIACVKAKTAADKKVLGTIDLLIASKIEPAHFYCPTGMKVADPFYEDTEFFQIKSCVIEALPATDQDLLLPASVRGLGWTTAKKERRTTAGRRVGSNMKDLRISYETRIRKDTKAAILEKAENKGMAALSEDEVELITDKPIEQTTIDAVRAIVKRLKASAKSGSQLYKVKTNINRCEAIEKDMLLVDGTK